MISKKIISVASYRDYDKITITVNYCYCTVIKMERFIYSPINSSKCRIIKQFLGIEKWIKMKQERF